MTFKVETGGKQVWVQVEPGIFSAPTQSYKLSIVEVAAMQQVVSANKLLEALNRDGFIALYINFDTGKAALKADGQATVREIVAMLKSAPALKIAIEGHTDNVGAAGCEQGALGRAREERDGGGGRRRRPDRPAQRRGLRCREADRRQPQRRRPGEEPARRAGQEVAGRRPTRAARCAPSPAWHRPSPWGGRSSGSAP